MIRAAMIALAAGLLIPPVGQPTFRAQVEGVRVDVMVIDGARQPFRGLAPEDFEIRDNGVPQKVDVISFGEVPLSVTLAFDLSESVAGERLRQLQNSLRGLADALEPRDESRTIKGWHAQAMAVVATLVFSHSSRISSPIGRTCR